MAKSVTQNYPVVESESESDESAAEEAYFTGTKAKSFLKKPKASGLLHQLEAAENTSKKTLLLANKLKDILLGDKDAGKDAKSKMPEKLSIAERVADLRVTNTVVAEILLTCIAELQD